jgi:arylsulfatase A-like enzyme
MLIMRGPGGFTGSRVLDSLVSQIDLFPTLCDLLEIDLPPWLQGRSLMPLIRSDADEVNDAIYSEVTYHAAYEPMRSARTARWNCVRRFDGRRTPVMPNCDDSPSKTYLLGHGWSDRIIPEEQLYDLVYDPNEACNLAGDPGHADVLADMRARLQAWMERTSDPLLDGPVAAPAGAQVNDPDSLSPREPVRIVGDNGMSG